MKKVKALKSQWSVMNFPKITDIVIGDEYKFVISVRGHSLYTATGKVKCISKLGGIVLKNVVLTNSSIKTTNHLPEFIFMFTDVSAIYKHKEDKNMATKEVPLYQEQFHDDSSMFKGRSWTLEEIEASNEWREIFPYGPEYDCGFQFIHRNAFYSDDVYAVFDGRYECISIGKYSPEYGDECTVRLDGLDGNNAVIPVNSETASRVFHYVGGDNEPTYSKDQRIRGIICTRKQYYFDPTKVVEGYPYRITFYEDTEIFDEKYKAGESIICLVSEALEEQINCVYVDCEKSVQRFTLVPTMKFEIEWLV